MNYINAVINKGKTVLERHGVFTDAESSEYLILLGCVKYPHSPSLIIIWYSSCLWEVCGIINHSLTH